MSIFRTMQWACLALIGCASAGCATADQAPAAAQQEALGTPVAIHLIGIDDGALHFVADLPHVPLSNASVHVATTRLDTGEVLPERDVVAYTFSSPLTAVDGTTVLPCPNMGGRSSRCSPFEPRSVRFRLSLDGARWPGGTTPNAIFANLPKYAFDITYTDGADVSTGRVQIGEPEWRAMLDRTVHLALKGNCLSAFADSDTRIDVKTSYDDYPLHTTRAHDKPTSGTCLGDARTKDLLGALRTTGGTLNVAMQTALFAYFSPAVTLRLDKRVERAAPDRPRRGFTCAVYQQHARYCGDGSLGAADAVVRRDATAATNYKLTIPYDVPARGIDTIDVSMDPSSLEGVVPSLDKLQVQYRSSQWGSSRQGPDMLSYDFGPGARTNGAIQELARTGNCYHTVWRLSCDPLY